MLEYVVRVTFESGQERQVVYKSKEEAENAYATTCTRLGFGEDTLVCVAFIESSEYGYVTIEETEF